MPPQRGQHVLAIKMGQLAETSGNCVQVPRAGIKNYKHHRNLQCIYCEEPEGITLIPLSVPFGKVHQYLLLTNLFCKDYLRDL